MFNSVTNLVTVSLALMGLTLGCGNSTDGQPSGIERQEDRISECGGFETKSSALFWEPEDPATYCDAEVLYWEYEEATGTLRLADARVLLNCCGDHGMTIEEQDGVYVVTETDAPLEDGGGRCRCVCVYDFTIEATGVPLGRIQLRIVREVTDWEEGSGVVFEGELDLSEGSGSIIIDDTDVGSSCGEG